MYVRSLNIDPSRITPNSDYLYVRKALAAEEVEVAESDGRTRTHFKRPGTDIYITDEEAEQTNLALILAVGPNVSFKTEEVVDGNTFVMVRDHQTDVFRLQEEDFMVRESAIEPYLIKK